MVFCSPPLVLAPHCLLISISALFRYRSYILERKQKNWPGMFRTAFACAHRFTIFGAGTSTNLVPSLRILLFIYRLFDFLQPLTAKQLLTLSNVLLRILTRLTRSTSYKRAFFSSIPPFSSCSSASVHLVHLWTLHFSARLFHTLYQWPRERHLRLPSQRNLLRQSALCCPSSSLLNWFILFNQEALPIPSTKGHEDRRTTVSFVLHLLYFYSNFACFLKGRRRSQKVIFFMFSLFYFFYFYFWPMFIDVLLCIILELWPLP